MAGDIVIREECIEAVDKPRAHRHLAISLDPELREEREKFVVGGKVAIKQGYRIKVRAVLFEHNSGTLKKSVGLVHRQVE